MLNKSINQMKKINKVTKVMTDDTTSKAEAKKISVWYRSLVSKHADYKALVYRLGGVDIVYGEPSVKARAAIKIAHGKIKKVLLAKGYKRDSVASILSRLCRVCFGFAQQEQVHTAKASNKTKGDLIVNPASKVWEDCYTIAISKLVSVQGKGHVKAMLEKLIATL